MRMRAVRGIDACAARVGVVVGLLGAACSLNVGGSAAPVSNGGAPSNGGAAAPDAGETNGSTPVDAGPLSAPSDDAGSTAALPTPDAGAATPDAAIAPDAAPVVACGSTSSIAAILAQYGSDSTASTLTPMGTRFESAAQAGPISSANATFLATASSNPDVSTATSATGLEWQAVTVKLYPSGTPTPEDIMQHAIGDCDGDSAMASMAYVNPGLVESVITDNHDGTYAIAMFDPTGKPINVAIDSEVLVDTGSTSSLGQVSANDGSADWATLLEKAVMKYDYAYGMVGQIDGIGSEELVPMFTGTGGSIAIAPGSLTPAQFQEVVTVSLAAGKLITGGFNQVLTLGQDQTVTAHGYAVMVPTDPTADMVDMRNPWGVNPWASSSASGYDTSTDGLLQIPLATTPTSWPAIVDLRIIDPGPSCTGVVTPFVPQIKPGAPIHIREPHARRAR
jgi:Calpain family cysteine protease